MADFLNLKAQFREKTGKGVARRLRAAGTVPAVYYVSGGASTPIQVNGKELRRVYEKVGRTTVFNVEIVGGPHAGTHPALIWDIEYYPTKNAAMHVDIFGVDLNKELKISVPLVFVGTPNGVKLGGTFESFRETLDVASKPLSVPQKIEINVADLDINQSIYVEDLKLPEGVRADYDTNIPLCGVVIVREDEAEADAGAEGEAGAGAGDTAAS